MSSPTKSARPLILTRRQLLKMMTTNAFPPPTTDGQEDADPNAAPADPNAPPAAPPGEGMLGSVKATVKMLRDDAPPKPAGKATAPAPAEKGKPPASPEPDEEEFSLPEDEGSEEEPEDSGNAAAEKEGEDDTEENVPEPSEDNGEEGDDAERDEETPVTLSPQQAEQAARSLVAELQAGFGKLLAKHMHDLAGTDASLFGTEDGDGEDDTGDVPEGDGGEALDDASDEDDPSVGEEDEGGDAEDEAANGEAEDKPPTGNRFVPFFGAVRREK